ncbi:MAG: flagellar motor protein [Nitrospirae bacterium]|nr:flagellar motor protein [Nitrospirota bacterium]
MDLLTIIGLVMAFGAIIGGQVLEGGHLGSIMQLTAFIIVMGGTFGAILIQSPLPVFLKGLSLLSTAILEPKQDLKADIKQVIDLANLSRKQGLLALEGKLKDVTDQFFRKGVQLIVDGTDAKLIHGILEVEMEHQEEEGINAAKIWESAGGYAPTVGIIGAVLGLIHVMENLSDPSKLGSGIAVAFVATVYGVGSANLLFLPLANKIKLKIKRTSARRAMIISGLVGLAQGENPRLLQEKLEGYLSQEAHPKEKKP